MRRGLVVSVGMLRIHHGDKEAEFFEGFRVYVRPSSRSFLNYELLVNRVELDITKKFNDYSNIEKSIVFIMSFFEPERYEFLFGRNPFGWLV
jgi:hypothetical protein